MGISGLLPALKSIQHTKHLSEFSGKTIAVDGYVWLHKGVFTCATELATGATTNKYVNYAMEKVRLLRHHGIEPYLVFDGGPLPAKKGTETERKRKRAENLARGNLLASQGKHAQARDCYLKCVDVTPQMAFQFIKALRAENVQYVVAPYEADAQLAYLERKGIVSAILTEDSDLLVFGCQNVLFKLDSVARTVVSISRSDFGAVTATAGEPNSISLVGWSDNQFRAMAILSGCDYLPSIQGVGLKTACTLLRKCKTPEAVVRSISLEGKRHVPKGYLDNFRLAESCFLYQRVYDPSLERLVHLTQPESGQWDDDVDLYVGRDIDPDLAKRIAVGDADPVSYLPMEDINSGFVPRTRVLQEISYSAATNLSNKSKGKGKARDAPTAGTILSFFGPNPVIPPRPRSLSSSSRRPITVKTMVVGKASGKRTLAEAMDQDLAVKKKRQREHHTTTPYPAFSRFFSKPVPASGSDTSLFKSKNQDVGPSRLGTDKENECIVIQDDTDEEDLASHVANGCHASKMDLDVDTEEDTVQQEDGYISPSPSRSCDTEELSSPPRPGSSLDARDLYEHDVLSSPSAAPGPLYLHQRSPSLSLRTPRSNFPADSSLSNGKVLVHASPEPEDKFSEKESFAQLDLRNFFSDDLRTEIDYSGDGSSTPSPSPLTPDDDSGMTPQQIAAVEGDGDLEINDPEVQELHASVMRTTAVAAGWRARWALGSAAHAHTPKACKDLPALRRRETNITPVGRHRLGVDFQLSRGHAGPGKLKAPDSAPAKSSLTTKSVGQGLKSRRSLIFFEHVSTSSKRVE